MVPEMASAGRPAPSGRALRSPGRSSHLTQEHREARERSKKKSEVTYFTLPCGHVEVAGKDWPTRMPSTLLPHTHAVP